MARYIDSDALKKHIRHRFMRLNSESKIGLKECKEIDAVIDEEKEILMEVDHEKETYNSHHNCSTPDRLMQ